MRFIIFGILQPIILRAIRSGSRCEDAPVHNFEYHVGIAQLYQTPLAYLIRQIIYVFDDCNLFPFAVSCGD